MFTRILVIFLLTCLMAVHAGIFPVVGERINPTDDLLNLVDFNDLQQTEAGERKKLDAGLIHLEGDKMPSRWKFQVTSNPKNTQGRIAFVKEDKRVFADTHFDNNLWNGAKLCMRAGVQSKALTDGRHAFGIWARGNGTLSLELNEFQGSKFLTTQRVAFYVSGDWKFYRSKPIRLKNSATDLVTAGIAAYGDIAYYPPELSKVATPDQSCELVFYVPFEKGNPEALFSAGVSSVFGASEPVATVPGISGDALRIDSKRRMTPLGMLRLPMGLQYMHVGDALPKEEGTLEFWFRPLKESLETKKWNDSPLFTIGGSATTWMWPSNEDMALYLRKYNGQLLLDYRERERYVRLPDETPVKIQTNVNEQKRCHVIQQTPQFVEQWYHLAVTWNKEKRAIFLDGKEVLKVELPKSPCISCSKPSLYLGCIALGQPYMASCDFDELKIYRGCRYLEQFTPDAKPLPFTRIQDTSTTNTGRTAVFSLTPFRVENDALAAELKGEKEHYRLRIEIGDGLPLIYSPKNAANSVIAPFDPALPPLKMSNNESTADGMRVTFARRDAMMTCKVTDESWGRRIILTLKRGEKDERVYLEPRVILEKCDVSAPWTDAYDGFSERHILLPFKPFAFQDLQTALPLTAAWNRADGMAVALAPQCLTSYISRGMTAPNKLCLKLRTVLDAGQSVSWEFELFRFDGAYGSNALVDAYHRHNPKFFDFDPTADPRLYANIAQCNVWNSATYRKRKECFSLSEVSRRIRGRWCWYYWTGAATGNWSVDQQLLADFPKLNEPRVGDGPYSAGVSRSVKKESDNIRGTGVNPALYISSWAEKRLAVNFRDSMLAATETENNIYFWKNYWTPGVTDYIMLPSGGRYGKLLRRQTANMLSQYPGTNCFSHDLFGGDYYFRKETTLGGLRAFDAEGMYTHNLAAMGKFLEDITAQPALSPYKTAVIGNGHAQVGSFMTFPRAVNTIHERSLTWALQDWGNLRQQTRLMGEKPSTFFEMPSLLGNYISAEKDSLELQRYALVAMQHSQLLMGMLFNVNVNWSVLGVKESVPMIDELLRVHSLGYRACQAFESSPSLASVRYGIPQAGALVLVNLSPEVRSSSIKPDAGYLGGMPLLAREGAELKFTHGVTQSLAVRPLSWEVVEMTGKIGGSTIDYASRLERRRDGRVLEVTFATAALSIDLEFGLERFEELVSVVKNGAKIPCALHGRTAKMQKMAVSPGDTLRITTHDSRWRHEASSILNIDFKGGEVCAAESLNAQAQRVLEFFRFWGVNQQPKIDFGLALKGEKSAKTRVMLECKAGETGIFLENECVILRGNDIRQLEDLLEEFLAALEKRYPYIGVFGNQMPVFEWDYATTGEQRRLLQKSGMVQKTQSIEEIAGKYLQWLKAAGIRTAEGF